MECVYDVDGLESVTVSPNTSHKLLYVIIVYSRIIHRHLGNATLVLLDGLSRLLHGRTWKMHDSEKRNFEYSAVHIYIVVSM